MELLLLMLLADMFKEEEKEDVLTLHFEGGRAMTFKIDHAQEKTEL